MKDSSDNSSVHLNPTYKTKFDPSALRVIGAGAGRTGTYSLKLALEKLLGGKCYHGSELIKNPSHVAMWGQISKGEAPAWTLLTDGYTAIVDLPGSRFWPELARVFPDAKILLSTRSPDSWWNSMKNTILETIQTKAQKKTDIESREFSILMLQQMFCTDINNELKMKQAYEKYNQKVRKIVPSNKLIEWSLGDGWAPICNALDVPVPKQDFPHTNSTQQYRAGIKFELNLS